MKKYWIKDGRFGNIYSLCWTDSEEMEQHLPAVPIRSPSGQPSAIARWKTEKQGLTQQPKPRRGSTGTAPPVLTMAGQKGKENEIGRT